MGYILIHPDDNVKVNPENGHKYASRNIGKGEKVIKYGFPIGVATADISAGEHVHSHNLKTALSGAQEYVYTPEIRQTEKQSPVMINAYERKNGEIGIRNDMDYQYCRLC